MRSYTIHSIVMKRLKVVEYIPAKVSVLLYPIQHTYYYWSVRATGHPNITNQSGRLYLINAPGGTGEIFLISLILETIRSRNKMHLQSHHLELWRHFLMAVERRIQHCNCCWICKPLRRWRMAILPKIPGWAKFSKHVNL